jgi:ankyrin repeat protein
VLLLAAANIGNAALVDLLLTHQADCFVADSNGWTVLSIIVFFNFAAHTQVLTHERLCI